MGAGSGTAKVDEDEKVDMVLVVAAYRGQEGQTLHSLLKLSVS